MPSLKQSKSKTVADIKANLLRPALSSHFDVEIGLPRALSLSHGEQSKLNLMCCEAVLPGSQLATIDVTNDFQGVTERHAYRRQFDQAIDLTFYVDAGNYIPIKFFEKWISYIMAEGTDNEMAFDNYSYRVRYPDEYTATGLTVTKFERDYRSQLQYEFVRSFPLAITSMPVSYEASSLLKVSVQMTYIRYILKNKGAVSAPFNPFQQSNFNVAGFLSNSAAQLVDAAVDDITGSDFLGDVAGGFAGQAVHNALT